MNCTGFELVKPLTLGNRLALTDYEIRWDSDGTVDVVLGIVPIMGNLVACLAYDLGIGITMISDDHPRLRRVCEPVACWLSKKGLKG